MTLAVTSLFSITDYTHSYALSLSYLIVLSFIHVMIFDFLILFKLSLILSNKVSKLLVEI